MNQLLTINQKIKNKLSGSEYLIEKFLGSGGQGEVYQIKTSNGNFALKWYFQQSATEEQKKAIDRLVKKGSPNNKFLWPLEIVEVNNIKGFGYIMPLRTAEYKSIVDLMKRKVELSFKAITIASIELADSFLQLHSKGLCYRDISFGNVFIHPNTGAILVCDNDNVAVDKEANAGVVGTPRFMAPEVVRVEAMPSIQTDLYSLAVLLFYMHMLHHPLEGKKESAIKCMDLPAMNKLYGSEPIFIFDPDNDSNRPVKGMHNNALDFWPLYPEFIKNLFIQSFTKGITDPTNCRVRESEWRQAMLKLKDSIVYCPHCSAENFYDADGIKLNGKLNNCWSCCKEINSLPPRIKINEKIVMLNNDTKLYGIHIEPQNNKYDFNEPLAELSQNPNNPSLWGLKNLMKDKWVAKTLDGSFKDIETGRSVSISIGMKINFGKVEGEIII